MLSQQQPRYSLTWAGPSFSNLLGSPTDTDVSLCFGALHNGEAVECVIQLRAHSSVSDELKTRAVWTGSGGQAVERNPPRSRYLDVNAALVSRRPRDWSTLTDMLLLGPSVKAYLTGIFIRRVGKPALAPHYGVPFSGHLSVSKRLPGHHRSTCPGKQDQVRSEACRRSNAKWFIEQPLQRRWV